VGIKTNITNLVEFAQVNGSMSDECIAIYYPLCTKGRKKFLKFRDQREFRSSLQSISIVNNFFWKMYQGFIKK
jgi:hypothetical protein